MSQRTCRDCLVQFSCFDEFFTAHGLSLTTRCPHCRARRQCERISGTVTRFFPARGFGFLVDDSGQTFFFNVADQGDAVFEVYIGQRLSFHPQRHTGAPHPRARRLAAVAVGDGEGSR